MKKLLLSLGTALLAVSAVAPAGSAFAAEITFVSVVGSWRDPTDTVPGSQPGDPVITNGNPISSISWGTTSGEQSGYDFIATLPPPFELPGEIPFFSLGTFQHRNFAVGEPWLTSAQLDVELVLAVDGVPTGPLTFTFTLNHDETPNDLDPCPYPTPPGEGCTDRVTIVASAEPTTFNVDGVDYTLEMSFLDNGSPVDEFITREGDTVNSSGLVGEFTLPPGLTVTKTGPSTMRLAEWGEFVIGVQNASEADAYSMTLVDRLPDGPTGGMCDTTPEVLSAQVFAADGVTPIAGKGPLTDGTDYSLSWELATCELTFTTLSAASVIGVDERLVITYRTQLDADSQDGVTLTNVAGAIEWLNADASTTYLRTLTDGTVGVGDHEDAHTVTVDLPLLRFEKTVINVTTGEDPGTVATPGDTLRYRLYVENLGNVPLDDFEIVDELDSLNADPMFQAGTLNVVTLPAGADAGNSDPNGGAAGTGLLDVRNLSIGGLGESVLVEFEVQLAPVIANETFVYNQSELTFDGLLGAVSDDPNVNGAADPAVDDD
ncbi:MAG: THxN family PEP-CTERM protein, partial [Woeseiaceae bacterium]|nr:THxN family PEP-CTERM protein [Woeseiaceae bacterium]